MGYKPVNLFYVIQKARIIYIIDIKKVKTSRYNKINYTPFLNVLEGEGVCKGLSGNVPLRLKICCLKSQGKKC